MYYLSFSTNTLTTETACFLLDVYPGRGKGGNSIWGRKFEDEFDSQLRVRTVHITSNYNTNTFMPFIYIYVCVCVLRSIIFSTFYLFIFLKVNVKKWRSECVCVMSICRFNTGWSVLQYFLRKEGNGEGGRGATQGRKGLTYVLTYVWPKHCTLNLKRLHICMCSTTNEEYCRWRTAESQILTDLSSLLHMQSNRLSIWSILYLESM